MRGRRPGRWSRCWVTGVAVWLTVAAASGATGPHGTDGHVHAGETAAGHLGSLDDGTSAWFWHTPWIACSEAPPPTAPSAPPSCTGGEMSWTVEVGSPATALRVDWDQPYRQDGFSLRVAGPDGAQATARSGGSLSEGVTFRDPAPGTWTVTLTPERTAGTVVRLRAALVGAAPAVEGELLPNLRVVPPFEFGFVAPANPTNSVFLANDDHNPGVAVGDHRPVSCTADEVQEAADPTQRRTPTALTRCLRFTAGPENAGVGHLDLRFPILDRAQHDRDRLVEMTQVVHHARPGLRRERPAGTYEYHATHGHYHYADILFYELFAVRETAAHGLEAVGVGHKSGFCPVDQGYAEWEALWQPAPGTVHREQSGGCLALGGDGAMGLSAGWGDVYRWQRPGQFVDFSGQPDGDYVVRATVDALGNVLESDETDNASYAWVRVSGDEVTVVERGRGASPWDPAKVVADDFRR